MIVDVKGLGKVEFPESMSEGEIRAVLRQFEPKKDDRLEKLVESMIKAMNAQTEALTKQKPTVIKENTPIVQTKVVQVDKPIIDKPLVVQDTKTEIKTVEIPAKQKKWKFTISRRGNLIDEIIAEALDG